MERLSCDPGGTLSACRDLHPDVTVLNSRISLNAHRAILSSLSPLVRSLFASVPTACTVSIILPEVSSHTLTLFIQALYTGIEKVSNLQPDSKRDLSELAARLDVQLLAGCALKKMDDDSTKLIEINKDGELKERMCSPEIDRVQERMQELNITHGQSVASDDRDLFDDDDYGEYTADPDGLQQNCPEEVVKTACTSVQCDLSLGYENDYEIEDNTKKDAKKKKSFATPDCTIYEDCVEELNDTNSSDREQENKSKFDDSDESLQKVSPEVDSDEEESFDKSEATLDDPSWEASVEEVEDTSEEEDDNQQTSILKQLKLTTKKSDQKSAGLKSIPLFKTPQNTKTSFHDVMNSSQMNTTASSRKKKLFTERIGPQELD